MTYQEQVSQNVQWERDAQANPYRSRETYKDYKGRPIDMKEFLRQWAHTGMAWMEYEAEDIPEEGSCMIGAGIEVYYIPKGKRKARRALLVHASHQGNISSWKTGFEITQQLRDEGIRCFFNEGSMN